MNVHCSTCGEPWDVYHLRHDAIWETGLPESTMKNWNGKLTSSVRAEFAAVGYVFGATHCNVRRCPCCPKDGTAKLDHAKDGMKQALEEVLGDDTDGIASIMEDLSL